MREKILRYTRMSNDSSTFELGTRVRSGFCVFYLSHNCNLYFIYIMKSLSLMYTFSAEPRKFFVIISFECFREVDKDMEHKKIISCQYRRDMDLLQVI